MFTYDLLVQDSWDKDTLCKVNDRKATKLLICFCNNSTNSMSSFTGYFIRNLANKLKWILIINARRCLYSKGADIMERDGLQDGLKIVKLWLQRERK